MPFGFLDQVATYINWEYGKLALGLLVVVWVARFAARQTKLKGWLGEQAKTHLAPKLEPHKRLFEAKRAESAEDWPRAGVL